MGLNSDDLMLQEINKLIRKYGLQGFRYRLYKRAAECVERQLSNFDIRDVFVAQIEEANLSNAARKSFINSVTAAIAKCRDAPKKRKE